MAKVTSLITRILQTSLRKRDLRDRYPQYVIGKGSYGDLEVRSWGEGAKLKVGAYVSFAQGVKVFLGGEHRPDWVTTFPFNVLWGEASHIKGHPATKGDVLIGNDVWVGTEALISSGVTIGDGAVIGARAVITKNVPPFAIVVGNPGRIVKYRFNEHVVSRLLAIEWWNWDDEIIQRALPDILSTNIEQFLDRAESNHYFEI